MFMSNSATVYQMISHFFFMIPMIVSQTTPAVILLATLMTFGTLSRHNEITAVKANGISLYRLAVPVLVLVLCICLFLFFFSEFVTPRAYERAEHIRLVEVQKQKELGAFKQNQIWYRGSRGIYNFRLFEMETKHPSGGDHQLLGPTVQPLQTNRCGKGPMAIRSLDRP
jgi:lipopolysaccharide export system permease protein